LKKKLKVKVHTHKSGQLFLSDDSRYYTKSFVGMIKEDCLERCH